jgi:hypothetical protein
MAVRPALFVDDLLPEDVCTLLSPVTSVADGVAFSVAPWHCLWQADAELLRLWPVTHWS